MTQNPNEAKKSRSFAEQSVFVSSIPSSIIFFQYFWVFFTYNFQVDPLFQVPEGFERLWCIHINFIRCSSKPHFGNGKTQWTGICGDNFCLGPCYIVMFLLFAGRSKRFEHLHDYDPTYHGQSKTDSKLYIISTA